MAVPTTLVADEQAQAQAVGPAQRRAKEDPPGVSGVGPRSDASNIKIAVALRASSQGNTAGDGPDAKGLSQGRAMPRTTTIRGDVAMAAKFIDLFFYSNLDQPSRAIPGRNHANLPRFS